MNRPHGENTTSVEKRPLVCALQSLRTSNKAKEYVDANLQLKHSADATSKQLTSFYTSLPTENQPFSGSTSQEIALMANHTMNGSMHSLRYQKNFLHTVSMVNPSLKELKRYLTLDQLFKEKNHCHTTLRARELADVQKVFYQMEQAVEQHRLESRTFEVKMNQVLGENERLLAQAIDKDIVQTVMNLSEASGENCF
ncbi:hypothetical protein Tco_0569494 [Tanacetum coccineum]